MSSCSEIHLHLQRKIKRIISHESYRGYALLDIGCWDGVKTMELASVASCSFVAGIEVFSHQARKAKQNGVSVAVIDLETEPFPFKSQTFDLVVCNQVFEHLKNIFHPMDEIARLLKPGGRLVISVPNLASFHNRVMLMLGIQPSSIRIFGPHVRGFAMQEFSSFLSSGGIFNILRIEGVGFYPFPAIFPGNQIAAMWKSACHTPIWVLQRTEKKHYSFTGAYKRCSEQTHM